MLAFRHPLQLTKSQGNPFEFPLSNISLEAKSNNTLVEWFNHEAQLIAIC